MQTYTVDSEAHPPAKDTGHHHYQGKGIVHSIESCGTVGSLGLRYVPFLQDCLMRCLYYHNRDTWDFHTDKCQKMTVEQVMRQVVFYRHYLEATGGGVTTTDGESLLQYEFVHDWLTACREHGIHTCLDTDGYALYYDSILEDLLDHTNLVMLDLKQIDLEAHKVLVGTPNTRMLNFARHLAECRQSTRVRRIVAPGYTNDECSAYLLGGLIGDMENVGAAELLPYHELGVYKWALCDDEHRLRDVYPPPKEVVLRVKEVLGGYGKPIIY